MTGLSQWYAREDAWIKYCRNTTIPVKMNRHDFETAFNMGWKMGRKFERRTNFKYLLKTKYYQPKRASGKQISAARVEEEFLGVGNSGATRS